MANRADDGPAATPAEIRATALAGAAQGCVFAMPVYLVVTEAGDVGIGPAPFAAVFVAILAGAAAIVCRFRESRDARVAVVVAGTVAGLAAGWGGARGVGFTLIVALVVALCAVAIGLRDTRIPIAGSFAIGSAAIGLEAVIAGGPQRSWAVPLAVLLPAFFLFSLSSRAVTVWTEGDATDLSGSDRGWWLARAGRSGIVLVAAMLVAVALGVRGGVLDRFGTWLAPVGNTLAAAFVFLASQVARPFLWLAEQVNVDPDGARRILDRVQRGAEDARRTAERHVGTPSLAGRLVGLAVIVGVVVLAIRLARRPRPEVSALPRPGRAPATVETGGVVEATAPARRPWGRPPADAVRRWYGEVLMAFRRAGVAKGPAATPAEFLGEASAALPAGADDFAALTRSYEDVRYGGAHLDRAALRRLEQRKRALLRLLRRPTRTG
jgi:hypothetical protein